MSVMVGAFTFAFPFGLFFFGGFAFFVFFTRGFFTGEFRFGVL